MNNQQAIDRLVKHLEWGWTEETVAAIEMGIHALKETQWIPCSEKMPEDNTDTEQAEVVLTFTKTESIDALIGELQDVKAMMNGSYPFENVSVRQKDLDFDAFMHIENNQIYRDFMKKGRE